MLSSISHDSTDLYCQVFFEVESLGERGAILLFFSLALWLVDLFEVVLPHIF
jgi:hypothetical protein